MSTFSAEKKEKKKKRKNKRFLKKGKNKVTHFTKTKLDFEEKFCKVRASLKSSDYYWPEPEPVALRAMGQVSTLTELE